MLFPNVSGVACFTIARTRNSSTYRLTIPTGPNSSKLQVLDHSLVVAASRSKCDHGARLHSMVWEVNFGRGSHFNRTGRVRYEHRDHRHWATIEATLGALHATKGICAVNRMVTVIVIVV